MAFSSGGEGPMADINIIPLCDVMLVLLIIFMITTPLMNHKVKVQLPQAVVEKKEEKKQQIPPVTISVTEAGELFFAVPGRRDGHDFLRLGRGFWLVVGHAGMMPAAALIRHSWQPSFRP